MASRRSKLSNLILVVLAALSALPAAAVAATRAKDLESLARFQQFAGEPAADQTGGPRNKDGSVSPERGTHLNSEAGA